MLEIGFVSGGVTAGGMANSTAGLATIASLLCPSESLTHDPSFSGVWAQCNYAGNYGGPGSIQSCNGIIVPSRGDLFVSSGNLGPTSLATVTDGLSNTAMFSEHLLGYSSGLNDDVNNSPAVSGSPFGKRSFFLINSVTPTPDQGGAGALVAMQLVAACKSLPPGTKPSSDGSFGANWLFSQGFDTLDVSYTHVMTPNGYSCAGQESGFFGAQGNFTSDGSGGGYTAASTPTSNHAGGVNIGFADGSVKFVKDSINLTTWWAIGTRGLGEVISADAY